MVRKITPALVLPAVCWLVFALSNVLLQGSWTRFGIIPRHVSSLPGILWAPFLHGSYQHLAANTLPLLILGVIICARNKSAFAWVTVAGTIGGGGLTWLFARPGLHIGASGLVFCFFGYLASLAYFRRTIGALILSIICIVGYGGMLRGIMPTSAPVSWEGHAAGLATGIALAWASVKPPRASKSLYTKAS